MSDRYTVALWLTPDAPGAAYIEEIEGWEVDNELDAASKWAYGDYVLGAAICVMYRCGVPSVFGAAVQVNGRWPFHWRYRIDLQTVPVRIRVADR